MTAGKDSDLGTRRALPIAVVGPGRLGSALAAALVAAGYPDVTLAGRAEGLPDIEEAVARASLVFLAVPDGAIQPLAAALGWRAGQAAVHLSGALGLDVLAAATEAGASPGCLHPLQSFPGGEPPDTAARRFHGIACGIEAAPPLHATLEALARDLGANTFRLEGVDRALYHASAVLVSNNVAALMAAATRAWSLAGLDAAGARGALGPLLQAAASAVAARPLVEALTGPVARGDATTVERHLEALAADEALLSLYRALGAELLRLDLGHPPEVRARLEALLGDEGRT